MVEQTAQIISNERDTDAYFRLVLRAPEIARATQPGQFLHLRVPAAREALLRRPFSIFQADGETVTVLYKTVGKGTEALARMGTGEELSAIGPLGHGFTVPARGAE
ncbi:MAG: FAD-binding oxidoreductase, partial [Verrucomicrobia bacterium]|nr:FAD-binding oxidoreductase [Verrucomicrobiota bacterium]